MLHIAGHTKTTHLCKQVSKSGFTGSNWTCRVITILLTNHPRIPNHPWDWKSYFHWCTHFHSIISLPVPWSECLGMVSRSPRSTQPLGTRASCNLRSEVPGTKLRRSVDNTGLQQEPPNLNHGILDSSKPPCSWIVKALQA